MSKEKSAQGARPERRKPTRSCVCCREQSDRRELVRFVRHADGSVDLDPSAKANGRGAYTCVRWECFEEACRKGRLASALKASLTKEDYERLKQEFTAFMDNRAQAQ